MVSCQLVQDKIECPLPQSEDRLMETFAAHRRLEAEYHDPRAFRYNLNAFLASVSSIQQILQKEVEQRGDVQRWNQVRDPFREDPWLKALARARNVTLHQQAIFDGSLVHIGMYRWRRHKLSVAKQLPHDVPSERLLKWFPDTALGKMFLDEEHSAWGEEYGVWRQYNIAEISETEDVLTMTRRGSIRSHDLLAAAHRLYTIEAGNIHDEYLLSKDALAQVTVLLESDIDPSLPSKWGWHESTS
ncbi:hypothetical protein ACFUCV_14470 [Specibacter sp. NPDC057265]|uniref:hypothetical protein n=1 Tax=Specibacter sp. NPDC057265 TaxID=3346075 RepID=UPI00362F8D62